MCAEQILNPDEATTFPARNIVGNRIDAPKVVTEVFARLGSHKEAITRHINRQISGKLTRADKDASRKSAPRTPACGTVTEATAAAGQAQDEGSSVMTFICRALETYLFEVLKIKLKDITPQDIKKAQQESSVAFDDGNPQVPICLRFYPVENRFDDMLRVFGLKAPCRYETPESLKRKLKLA